MRGRVVDWVWEAGRGGDGGLRTGHEIGTLCGGPGPVSRDLRMLTGKMPCDVMRPTLTPSRHIAMQYCKYRFIYAAIVLINKGVLVLGKCVLS
mgnify:FL=1